MTKQYHVCEQCFEFRGYRMTRNGWELTIG
jgi:hypothetical protein